MNLFLSLFWKISEIHPDGILLRIFGLFQRKIPWNSVRETLIQRVQWIRKSTNQPEGAPSDWLWLTLDQGQKLKLPWASHFSKEHLPPPRYSHQILYRG